MLWPLCNTEVNWMAPAFGADATFGICKLIELCYTMFGPARQ